MFAMDVTLNNPKLPKNNPKDALMMVNDVGVKRARLHRTYLVVVKLFFRGVTTKYRYC